MNSPSLRPYEMFHNVISFYGEELLAPYPTLKLEEHPLSAVRDFLFNIFTATLRIWRPFLHLLPEDMLCHGDGTSNHEGSVLHLSESFTLSRV
jgi:hypothetical protein